LSEPGSPIAVFITLGSNIAPEYNLRRAVALLGQNHHLTIRAVSRVYTTAPVSASGAISREQPPFLNAAASVASDGYYSPLQLKFNVLRFIELLLGRKRSHDKFAPRVIDLDIALYGNLVIHTPYLTIPDPAILTRAHVALPLADLAPDHPHPITGEPLGAIAASFAGTPGITVRDDIRLT